MDFFKFDIFKFECIPQHMVEGYPLAWIKAFGLVLLFVVAYNIVNYIVKSKAFKYAIIGLLVALAYGVYQSETAKEQTTGWGGQLLETVEGIMKP